MYTLLFFKYSTIFFVYLRETLNSKQIAKKIWWKKLAYNESHPFFNLLLKNWKKTLKSWNYKIVLTLRNSTLVPWRQTKRRSKQDYNCIVSDLDYQKSYIYYSPHKNNQTTLSKHSWEYVSAGLNSSKKFSETTFLRLNYNCTSDRTTIRLWFLICCSKSFGISLWVTEKLQLNYFQTILTFLFCYKKNLLNEVPHVPCVLTYLKSLTIADITLSLMCLQFFTCLTCAHFLCALRVFIFTCLTCMRFRKCFQFLTCLRCLHQFHKMWYNPEPTAKSRNEQEILICFPKSW